MRDQNAELRFDHGDQQELRYHRGCRAWWGSVVTVAEGAAVTNTEGSQVSVGFMRQTSAAR
jgi:hypothetical protein